MALFQAPSASLLAFSEASHSCQLALFQASPASFLPLSPVCLLCLVALFQSPSASLLALSEASHSCQLALFQASPASFLPLSPMCLLCLVALFQAPPACLLALSEASHSCQLVLALFQAFPPSLPALFQAPLFLPLPQASPVLPVLPHPGCSWPGLCLRVLHLPSHLWFELPPHQLPPAAKRWLLIRLPCPGFLPIPGFLPSHSWQHNVSGGKQIVSSNFLFFLHCLDSFSYPQVPALPQLLLVQLQPVQLLLLVQLASSWPCFKPLL